MARTNPAPLKTARWAEVRAHVAHRASFRCEHCQRFLGMTGEADHVVPRSDIDLIGIGVFDPSNLQYLCSSCHSSKSNRERWSRQERAPKRVRSNVPGRHLFLDAAGISPTQ